VGADPLLLHVGQQRGRAGLVGDGRQHNALWPDLQERAPCPPLRRWPATLLSPSVAVESDLQERTPSCSRPPVRLRCRAARPLLYGAQTPPPPTLLWRRRLQCDTSSSEMGRHRRT
jgi:hypothetical protein